MITSCQTITHVCISVNLLQELLTFYFFKKMLNKYWTNLFTIGLIFLTYIESHLIVSKKFIILSFPFKIFFPKSKRRKQGENLNMIVHTINII